MTLDLNHKPEITPEAVAQFIASVDDSVHRQLRVTEGGVAFMSDTVGNAHTEGIAFRLETFMAGNDYVGPKAAQDVEWVTRVHDALHKHWPRPESTYIDQF